MKKSCNIMQVQILICTCLLSLSCYGQQNFDTLVDYNNYVEFPYSIYQVQDSGYIFTTGGDSASTDFIEFNKLNKNGSIAYQKTFGFLGYQLYVGLANSMKPTFNGGWALGGGYVNSSNNFGKGMLVKYNPNGDTQFVKIIGDTAWTTFYDCIQTSDSSFILVGDYYTTAAQSDFWIVKTDSNGNVLWERTLGTSLDEQAFVVIENAQHQIVVSGAKENASLVHYPYAAIYDLQGNLITTKSFNQGALLSGGGGTIRHFGVNEYILTGSLNTVINIGDYPTPEYIARLDSNFNFKWMTVYNSPELKDIYIMKEISDGGIVLVGFRQDSTIGYSPVGWIAKMDSSGNKLWEHSYLHSTSFNYFSDFQETFDHGFIICGMTATGTSQDSWIVKLDSNGCLDNTCGLNTGTHELVYNTFSLNIFPNPTNQNITVVTNEEKGQLILYDLLGKEILRRNTEYEKQITLHVSGLSNGIYLLQFKTEKGLFTGRVVKE